MANNQKLNRSPQNPQITPEMMDRLINLQEAELSTRTKELEIRQLEITKSHEFSKDGLAAQITDRENARTAKQKSDNSKYIFLGIISFLVLLFLGFSIWMNKDTIALEIVKAAGFVLAGYFGGKFHQKSKDEKKDDN